MIFYKNSGLINFWINLFQRSGSVFPFAFSIAFPCSTLAVLLEWLYENDYVQLQTDVKVPIMNENAVWGGFTFLVGFLIVFRTSIAYQRFWDGATSVHKMRAEWFDACSSICAFCRYSDASNSKIETFQHTLIRLFSLLHAIALAEIEDSVSDEPADIEAYGLELIDDVLIDDNSLLAIRDSQAKVELIFQWIQQIIVENMKNKILNIPPPILSRAFQELANGMVEFHESLKVSTIPFPFPYAQTCDFLLLVHGIMTPVVVTQWVNGLWWVFIFSFILLFIMWTLRAIAVELENPFGMDANDLEESIMQDEMNAHLALLVSPECKRIPTLQGDVNYWNSKYSANTSLSSHSKAASREDGSRAGSSLMSAWNLAHSRTQDFSQFDVDAVPASTTSVAFETNSQSSRQSGRAVEKVMTDATMVTRRLSVRSTGKATGVKKSDRHHTAAVYQSERSSVGSHRDTPTRCNRYGEKGDRHSGTSIRISRDVESIGEVSSSEGDEGVRRGVCSTQVGQSSRKEESSAKANATHKGALDASDENFLRFSACVRDLCRQLDAISAPSGRRFSGIDGPELEPGAECEARDAKIRSKCHVTASRGNTQGNTQKVEYHDRSQDSANFYGLYTSYGEDRSDAGGRFRLSGMSHQP